MPVKIKDKKDQHIFSPNANFNKNDRKLNKKEYFVNNYFDPI